MNTKILAVSALLLAGAASAGEFPITEVSVGDMKSSLKGTAQEPAARGSDENERLYQAGAAARAKVLKEGRKYFLAEKKRAKTQSAFATPTPEGLANQQVYAQLREKNAGFVSNVAYWQEQVRTLYPRLTYAVKVNDLATANTILGHMRDDHFAIENEVAAIEDNNRKARAWPRQPTNEEEYQAGAGERASILAQAAAAADLEGRGAPENAFVSPTPASVANKARYEELREKNAGFLRNIEYWRNQLPANHSSLKEAVGVNDLKTARILLDYLKKDSAALTNEIQAVQKNNDEASRL